jgi:hypothetical protein
VSQIKHGTPEWREMRRGKINISTAVNILYPGMTGVRGTPLTEYQRIVTELDGTNKPEEHDEELADILSWGSNTEALHMSILQRKSPEWEITSNDKLVVHPDMDFVCGTPDGFATNTTINRRAIVELKAPINFEPWGSECPVGPRTQCMLYASMCGADMGIVSALIPPTVRVYIINRDGPWEDWAWSTITHFWNEHVVKRIPPAARYAKDMDALKGMDRQKEKSVELGEELRMYAEQLEEGKEMIKAGENLEQHARMKILEAMGDAEVARFKDGTGFQFTTQTRNTPAREASTSTYRVFRQLKK